jgi:hypothetical protein
MVKLGDVVQIPLPTGENAYGRIFQDASIGVYNFVSKSTPPLEDLEVLDYLFITGVFDTAIKSGEWKLIGNLQFPDEDSRWPPPKYIQDIIQPQKYRIYFKGNLTKADKSEIKGLEKQAMYKPAEIVAEIMSRHQ